MITYQLPLHVFAISVSGSNCNPLDDTLPYDPADHLHLDDEDMEVDFPHLPEPHSPPPPSPPTQFDYLDHSPLKTDTNPNFISPQKATQTESFPRPNQSTQTDNETKSNDPVTFTVENSAKDQKIIQILNNANGRKLRFVIDQSANKHLLQRRQLIRYRSMQVFYRVTAILPTYHGILNVHFE